VCCAAAIATIELMEKENLNARAQEIAKIVDDRFRKWQKRFKCVGVLKAFCCRDSTRPTLAMANHLILSLPSA